MANDNGIKIGAVSLFSGAGGLDVASFLAGVPVLSSTDFDDDCIETLKLNDLYEDTEIIKGDLHQIDSDVFRAIVQRRNPDKFIVIGGAPCQPFSKAGYWVGNNTRKGINDPRATLVDEYLRVVTDLHPDGFVFENVESLLHPTNKIIVDRFIEIIQENGYNYKIVRANALDYGVSQKRKRLFIIGTTGEFKSEEPHKTHCPPEDCAKTGLLPYVNVGEVIQGGPVCILVSQVGIAFYDEERVGIVGIGHRVEQGGQGGVVVVTGFDAMPPFDFPAQRHVGGPQVFGAALVDVELAALV